VLPAGEEVLWLDPGMAFGTGNPRDDPLCCERLARFAGDAPAVQTGDRRRAAVGHSRLAAAKLGFGQIAGFAMTRRLSG